MDTKSKIYNDVDNGYTTIESLCRNVDVLKMLVDADNQLDNVLRFTTMGKPKAASRPRATTVNGNVRMYSNDTRDNTIIKNEMVEKGLKVLTDKDVHLRIELYLPTPKSFSIKDMVKAEYKYIRPCTKPDVDNYAKFYMDCMNGIVYHDDSQVTELTVVKYYSIQPRVMMIIVYG
jgi:Holliday junction resolvase RusA-like endonuclease